MKNQVKIPMWINVFGGILAAFGLGMGIMGYLNPEVVISGFTGDTNAHKMAMWMTSGRNIAMAVVMGYALFSKKPELIGLAFLMRLVTEITDMPATALSGVMGVPAMAVYAAYLLLFITPEIFAIIKMKSLAEANR